MHIVDLSIKRPILISMGLIALVMFGLIAYFNMPLSLLPSIKTPYITVQTIYAGASPEVIENSITKKIEDSVSAISDLDTIVSYSMDSVSIVMVQFTMSKNEDMALQEVKDKVDSISASLPENAKKSVITKMNLASMTPIMNIVVKGSLSDSELYTFAKETAAQTLSQISGIGSVEISGGAEREIQVRVKNSTVFERNIPLTQIAGIIAQANMDMPGGNVTYQNQDIPVQLKGTFSSVEEIKNLDVPTNSGIYKIHQLADVVDTAKTVRQRTILLDKEENSRNDNVILLQIMKNPSGNTVDIIENVNKKLPEIEKKGKGAVQLSVISEDKTFVNSTVNDTLSNVYLGVILTGLVLFIFLHDWRSTLIVALAMPFSILCSFFVMKGMGYSLDLVSLLGISCSTGSLVTNSVVVLENIFRQKNNGLSNQEAASVGTKEVIVAIFASTLTNIAVFFPIGFAVRNMFGPILAEFAYTTIIATVFSILVSFTLTPLLASRILPETGKESSKKTGSLRKFSDLFDSVIVKITGIYQRSLGLIIKNRKNALITIAASFAIFVASLFLVPFIGYEIMPVTDGGKININLELPQGSSLEETAKYFEKIEGIISKHYEVVKMQTVLGTLGSTDFDVSIGRMTVYLTPKSKRSKRALEIANDYTKELSVLSGAKISITAPTEITVAGMNFNVDLYLKGEDMNELIETASMIQKRLNRIEGLSNVTLSSKSGKKELDFFPDRKAISNDGLTVTDLAMALRGSIDGLTLTKYKENNIEYDLRVQLADSSLSDIEDIKNIPVVSPKGTFPLKKYASVEFRESTNKILRTDKMRTIEITADILNGYAIGKVQTNALKAIKEIDLPEGITLETAGTSKLMNETLASLGVAFILAIIVIYMLLAGTLENLKQPLFILSTVPLSLIGVIVSSVVTNVVLNMIAILGIIMLVGIVVNNAILILDEYNAKRKTGLQMQDAMISACGGKLRSILMSNLAIVLGMVPMALGIGEAGSEMRIPMGIIIIGGIIASTIMTLFLIPALEKATTRTEAKS